MTVQSRGRSANKDSLQPARCGDFGVWTVLGPRQAGVPTTLRRSQDDSRFQSQVSGVGEGVQEQVEVDKPSVWRPATRVLLHFLVAGGG